jgi:polyisoprenyl-phosphate glycosyltransferase
MSSDYSPAMKSASLWLIAPVYQDVESFIKLREKTLEIVSRHLVLRRSRLRFVAVDDTGGFDPEVQRLHAFGDVTVVQPPFNLGHQRAIVYGIRSVTPEIADSDVVVTLDSDGEDRPDDLPRLLAPILEEPTDLRRVVLALRTGRRETPVFKAMYLSFKVLFRLLTGISVRTGNYAAYRGWFARHLILHPYFDLCYSSTLVSLNLPVTYVPCARGGRYAGQSRMNYQKLFMHGLRMLMPLADRIAIRALFAFFITFCTGMTLSVAVLAVRLFTKAAIPGWATSTLLLVLTLSFVALGNFVVLFAVFSQSQGISLSNLEHRPNEHPRSASASAD